MIAHISSSMIGSRILYSGSLYVMPVYVMLSRLIFVASLRIFGRFAMPFPPSMTGTI